MTETNQPTTPTTLDVLFSTDPKYLTDAQINEIIAEYRAHFGTFAADEAAGKPVRRTKVVKKANTILDDLGLRK
jgi:hypothetical protein